MSKRVSRFSQAQAGVFDEASFVDLGGRGGVYQVPTFKSYWEARGGRYSPELQRFMDDIVYGEAVKSMQDRRMLGATS